MLAGKRGWFCPFAADEEKELVMNGSQIHVHHERRYLPETKASGSVTEGVGAVSVIALSILGLIGVLTNAFASIATVIAGLVFLADSMLARSAAYRLHEEGAAAGLGAGASAGFYAGLGSIVLGIVSFFQAMPERAISIAVLAMGAALFVSGGPLARLNASTQQPQESNTTWSIHSGGAFLGLAVTVLGILAVIGYMPMTLSLVGLLCLGTGALFSEAPSEAAQT
jgi:hypothetical protein